MPGLAALTCTPLTTPIAPAAHPWWLFIEGVDFTPYLSPDGFLLEDLGGAPGRLQLTLKDPTPVTSFVSVTSLVYSEQRVLLYNAVNDYIAFQGWIKDVRPTLYPGTQADLTIDCSDLSDVADWTPIPTALSFPLNMRLDAAVNEIVGLCGGYLRPFTGTMTDLLQVPVTIGPKAYVRPALDQLMVATNSYGHPMHAYYIGREGTVNLTSGAPVATGSRQINNDAPDDLTNLAAMLTPDYDANAEWDSIYGAGTIGNGGDGYFGPVVANTSRRVFADPLRIKIIDAPAGSSLDRSNLFAMFRSQQNDVVRVTATLDGYAGTASEWQRGWGLNIVDSRLWTSPISTIIAGVTLSFLSKTNSTAGLYPMGGAVPRYVLNLNAAAQRFSLGAAAVASTVYKP